MFVSEAAFNYAVQRVLLYICKPDMTTVKPHAVRSADSLQDGRKRFSSPEGSVI